MGKNSAKTNKKFKLNPFVIVALVLCALAVVYTATTAWLTGTPINPVRFTELQDFNYDLKIYFEGANTPVVDTANGVNPNGVVSVNFSDPSEPNYVGKLRAEVTHTGKGVAFSRLKISHEWLYTPQGSTEATRLQGDYYLPYIINDGFKDSREFDGYVYHEGAMADGETVSVITGFDAAAFDASAVTALSGTVTLTVNISVDAVQFNRYQQIWNMDSIPWR